MRRVTSFCILVACILLLLHGARSEHAFCQNAREIPNLIEHDAYKTNKPDKPELNMANEKSEIENRKRKNDIPGGQPRILDMHDQPLFNHRTDTSRKIRSAKQKNTQTIYTRRSTSRAIIRKSSEQSQRKVNRKRQINDRTIYTRRSRSRIITRQYREQSRRNIYKERSELLSSEVRRQGRRTVKIADKRVEMSRDGIRRTRNHINDNISSTPRRLGKRQRIMMTGLQTRRNRRARLQREEKSTNRRLQDNRRASRRENTYHQKVNPGATVHRTSNSIHRRLRVSGGAFRRDNTNHQSNNRVTRRLSNERYVPARRLSNERYVPASRSNSRNSRMALSGITVRAVRRSTRISNNDKNLGMRNKRDNREIQRNRVRSTQISKQHRMNSNIRVRAVGYSAKDRPRVVDKIRHFRKSRAGNNEKSNVKLRRNQRVRRIKRDINSHDTENRERAVQLNRRFRNNEGGNCDRRQDEYRFMSNRRSRKNRKNRDLNDERRATINSQRISTRRKQSRTFERIQNNRRTSRNRSRNLMRQNDHEKRLTRRQDRRISLRSRLSERKNARIGNNEKRLLDVKRIKRRIRQNRQNMKLRSVNNRIRNRLLIYSTKNVKEQNEQKYNHAKHSRRNRNTRNMVGTIESDFSRRQTRQNTGTTRNQYKSVEKYLANELYRRTNRDKGFHASRHRTSRKLTAENQRQIIKSQTRRSTRRQPRRNNNELEWAITDDASVEDAVVRGTLKRRIRNNRSLREKSIRQTRRLHDNQNSINHGNVVTSEHCISISRSQRDNKWSQGRKIRSMEFPSRRRKTRWLINNQDHKDEDTMISERRFRNKRLMQAEQNVNRKINERHNRQHDVYENNAYKPTYLLDSTTKKSSRRVRSRRSRRQSTKRSHADMIVGIRSMEKEIYTEDNFHHQQARNHLSNRREKRQGSRRSSVDSKGNDQNIQLIKTAFEEISSFKSNKRREIRTTQRRNRRQNTKPVQFLEKNISKSVKENEKGNRQNFQHRRQTSDSSIKSLNRRSRHTTGSKKQLIDYIKSEKDNVITWNNQNGLFENLDGKIVNDFNLEREESINGKNFYNTKESDFDFGGISRGLVFGVLSLVGARMRHSGV